MQLHQLKSPKGSRKKKRIVGRGRGSGLGKTSGRGENGQKSRRGWKMMKQFEGGQIPLIRRLPKVGFTCQTSVVNQVVSLKELSCFKKGDVVNVETLKEKGLISSVYKPFKVLANGEISVALTFQLNSVSKSAREKIEKQGGKIEIVQSTRPKKVVE